MNQYVYTHNIQHMAPVGLAWHNPAKECRCAERSVAVRLVDKNGWKPSVLIFLVRM